MAPTVNRLIILRPLGNPFLTNTFQNPLIDRVRKAVQKVFTDAPPKGNQSSQGTSALPTPDPRVSPVPSEGMESKSSLFSVNPKHSESDADIHFSKKSKADIRFLEHFNVYVDNTDKIKELKTADLNELKLYLSTQSERVNQSEEYMSAAKNKIGSIKEELQNRKLDERKALLSNQTVQDSDSDYEDWT